MKLKALMLIINMKTLNDCDQELEAHIVQKDISVFVS